MDRPLVDDSRFNDPSLSRPGHLFAGADPDVILAMTADILNCLGDFTRLYAGEDMPRDSVRGLGYMLGMVGDGLALAHDGVVELLDRTSKPDPDASGA